MRAKILVIEDEQDMVDLLSFNLRAAGFEVLVATTGLEGLNCARRSLPDLVLLDLMLEGIDGFSVCEILRSQPSTAQTPVIMVTAMNGQFARIHGLAAGANDFVRKPFSMRELLQRIETTLQEHGVRQKALLADPPPDLKN